VKLARARLVLGQRGPEAEALRDHLRGVAAVGLVGRGTPGGPDDQVDLPLKPVDGEPGVGGGLAGPEGGRAHPQAGQRRPQPVRQVGRHHPLGRDQPAQPLGHQVERVTGGGQLGGPADGGPDGQLAVAEHGGGRRELARGLGDAGRQAVGHHDGDGDQDERDRRHHRPGRRHAPGGRRGGDVDHGDRHAAAGQRHRLQHRVAAGHGRDEGPGRGSGGLKVRRARPLRAADQGSPDERSPGERPGRGGRAGEVDGELAGRAGRGADDGAVEGRPVGGDREHRLDRGPGQLGGRECLVPRHVPDDERERDEEGDRHHRGDRRRHHGQRRPDRRAGPPPARRLAHRGASSITPTPRTVCR
jgi:hypothetical protein